MKIKLILRPEEFTSFTSYYLESFWREYFDVEWYDHTVNYDRSSTVFVVWCANANSEWTKKIQDLGYCVVVDHLWESVGDTEGFYLIKNSNWFWYNECLWWQALGHDKYIPERDIKYRAFMPIRKTTPDRDLIVKHLESLLDSMLWSYNSKTLPNDTDDPDQGQRYYYPSWYNSTYSSLVVETYQAGPLFLSEKSFKPMAFYHPYQIIGTPGTLAELKQLGFETFDNMFDETYDNIEDLSIRLKVIINNLQALELIKYDQLTEQKLQHNHARFFNTSLVKQCIVDEIINPLIEHVGQNT